MNKPALTFKIGILMAGYILLSIHYITYHLWFHLILLSIIALFFIAVYIKQEEIKCKQPKKHL